MLQEKEEVGEEVGVVVEVGGIMAHLLHHLEEVGMVSLLGFLIIFLFHLLQYREWVGLEVGQGEWFVVAE